MVTLFKDLTDINNPYRLDIQNILLRIKNGKSKDTIEEIRNKFKKGEDVEVLKKSLPFVVFSASNTKEVTSERTGKQTHREDKCVTEHSGYFVLDFDKCDVGQKIDQLKKDPYIFACWIGPKGNGVKALVKCPPSVENHPLYYTAFLDRYPELDSTSRNISRGTFESYDPDIFVNQYSVVWDKTLTEEERVKNKESEKNRRGTQILSTAVGMVRASYDGIKHDSLLKAATLVGGYVATGRVDEEIALKVLEDEIKQKAPKNLPAAIQTIKDGIKYGKTRPLHESKQIERAQSFLKRQDGTYDFLASNEEMTEYEISVINGTLEMGLPTGLNGLNRNWMFKKHHIVWFGGADNVGKSFLVWYLCVLAAMLHGWKITIQSAENSDGQLRKKLKEFFLGKSLKLADDEELTIADDFIKNHFRIISSKQFHSLEDFLLKCEVIYDEGFEFDLVVAEPWNSFDPPRDLDRYSNTIHSLNLLRVFKERYAAVWVCDHINSEAARRKDPKTGFVVAPYKSDIEMGQMKANKTDDFIILHRLINSPLQKNDLEIHVHKIKDVETGGYPTEKDCPVVLTINSNYCGYTCNYVDPVKELWKKRTI